MSTVLQPVITKAGLAAVWRADNSGLAVKITHIALGTAGYSPSTEQKALRTEAARHVIAGGERLGNNQLHLTAIADGAHAFWVREVGFVLEDGTLFAVWSHPSEALAYKPAGTDLLLAYDLSLSALPADSVTIVSNGAGLSLTLAAPLAAQASALIAEQLRNLLQQDRLDSQQQAGGIATAQLQALRACTIEMEQRQVDVHQRLLTVVAANAASLVSLQTLVVKHIHGE
ncbi:phage tail-collar fiber domain-containing protein [Pseudomonas carassii]|uniref:Phage tail protein n=1 Tax=Pseudomonas carassii TaxID=3115855 RepID=A0ABU7HB55_9PSED|nr:phage tail protein [Pseudomonas sp. 137P]MEE1888498.1 phage tail protein [Pseudomonas sp. 137P]